VGRHKNHFGVDAADGAEQPVRHPPSRRSATATPGRSGDAVKSRGWSVTPTMPMRERPRWRMVGGRAVAWSRRCRAERIPRPTYSGTNQAARRTHIEQVAVSESHEADAKKWRHLGGHRRGPGEGCLPRIGPTPLMVGDRALEIEDEHVRQVGGGYAPLGEKGIPGATVRRSPTWRSSIVSTASATFMVSPARVARRRGGP